MRGFLIFIILAYSAVTFSQVKIGDNPSSIHSSSILELESTDKVLVISRMTTSQINAISPSPQAGALVYDTNQKCVFMYDGTSWRSLCNSISGFNVFTGSTTPTGANLGDFWINETLKTTSIYNGSYWVTIDNNPSQGSGAPNATTAPSPLAGDVYVDTTTGNMYAYDGTTWVQSGGNVNANNGVLVSADNTVQLGGTLIRPTVITTNATNTLTIEGLQTGDITQDEIVTINSATGQLRKVTTTNLLREEVTKTLATATGQVLFTGLNLRSTDKVNVYRNGVRIDFTIVDNTTIEIENEAACYIGDEIRIVQFY